MYVEKRISGSTTKYYLVHSYRDINNKVQKIRKYLGSNCSKKEIEQSIVTAKKEIAKRLAKIEIEIFDFALSRKQIASLNRYDDKIKIVHFSDNQWEKFTEEFVFNTNAIEGSKVLEDEVHDILQKGNTRNPDEIETVGVANAVEYIRKTKQDLSIDFLLKLHELCFKDSKSFAGSLRKVEVVIRGRDGSVIHAGTPVNNLKEELKEYIRWYHANKSKFKPIVLAAIVHNQFEDIHPFQDGNGRVGRLLLNFILIKNKYPPINILLKDREKYYGMLQEYQKKDRVRPTLKFLIDQYKKTLKQVSTKR